MPDNVVRLFQTGDRDEHQTSAPEKRKPEARITNVTDTGSDQPHLQASALSVDDIYPDKAMIGSDLSTALRLLAEAAGLINDAIDRQRSGDRVQADDAMQQLQVLLPELFFCRSLGDGFGAVINSLFHGMRNLGGAPLSQEQMLAIRGALMTIRNEPFLRFENAIDQVRELGLLFANMMPSGMEIIDKALDELGDRNDSSQARG